MNQIAIDRPTPPTADELRRIAPFDMVVLNRMSRLHLCLDVPRYVPDMLLDSGKLIERCTALLTEHHEYIREHFDDLPEIKDWAWSD